MLISALTHAAWNLSGKSGRASVGQFTLAVAWSALLGVPLLAVATPLIGSFTPAIWGLVVLTGFFQAAYLAGLTLAYQRGELSILYPLIRSSPLLILVFGGLLLGTLERIGPGALIGIALIAATATAGYSLVDDTATRWIRALADPEAGAGYIALVYVVLQAWSSTAWLALLLCWRRDWRAPLRGPASQHGQAIRIGLLMLGTYALVVWAMAYARDVSYVAAFRQISILIGVALGIGLLKERLTAPKIVGSLGIFAGLVCVALD